MKLFKRGPAIEISRNDFAFNAGLYAQLTETIAVYRRLSEAHAHAADAEELGPQAIGWARAGALTARYADAVMQDPSEPLLATLPEDLSQGCILAMLALERLCYALCALGEEDVLDEALLGSDELDRLLEANGLGEWLAANRQGAEGAVARGHPPPEPWFSPEILDTPYLEGGKTPLRELLLTREVPDIDALREEPDAPPGGPRPEGFYFAGLNLATLVLIIHHGAVYLDLLRAHDDEGPSADIDATAISAAVDIAAVQQSSWRRLDMIGSVRHTPLDPGPAMGLLDDLIFNLLLLTGRDPERAPARLDPAEFDSRLRSTALLDWVEAAGYDRGLPADGIAAIREARAEGAGDDELLSLALRTIERAAIAASDSGAP